MVSTAQFLIHVNLKYMHKHQRMLSRTGERIHKHLRMIKVQEKRMKVVNGDKKVINV